MVAHFTVSQGAWQADFGVSSEVFCPAKAMGPDQRQDLAVRALAGEEPMCRLAAENGVSRKFLSRQVDRAETALQQAFDPQYELPAATLCQMFNTEALDPESPVRWTREASLRRQLGCRFQAIHVAVAALAQQAVRASSIFQNLNSRLRPYFFLRRHLGSDYLALLQFFLNHRRFPRSERPERVGKSPAELLTSQTHPHWLEMLGYERFDRN